MGENTVVADVGRSSENTGDVGETSASEMSAAFLPAVVCRFLSLARAKAHGFATSGEVRGLGHRCDAVRSAQTHGAVADAIDTSPAERVEAVS